MCIAFLMGHAIFCANRCINRFQRIEIIQPQIVLRQFRRPSGARAPLCPATACCSCARWPDRFSSSFPDLRQKLNHLALEVEYKPRQYVHLMNRDTFPLVEFSYNTYQLLHRSEHKNHSTTTHWPYKLECSPLKNMCLMSRKNILCSCQYPM
ncbi:Uncharacterised protein [Salmonella enterica subsp. enterica]|uniref:Uncharacterized protein n=1 Tax=Salmonella enterica I TaxID=59201 RepID=A0A3S4I2J3_SALET|nr:Uncharacterised protein [Salmonella enterica subsp. enterica]